MKVSVKVDVSDLKLAMDSYAQLPQSHVMGLVCIAAFILVGVLVVVALRRR